MFTGLVEVVGEVARVARSGPGARLTVKVAWPDRLSLAPGDSVAVDGACLTAREVTEDGFSADLSPETLDRTLLGSLRVSENVNLERALRLGDRLGGHLVQGHVDGVVRLLSIRDQGAFSRWRLSLPTSCAREVASKGSIAVHGVSLTVAELGADWFEVALIPETLRATTLGGLSSGAQLHIETDVLAKYVARRLGEGPGSALDEVFGSGGRGA
jgi:riboflavin synthase